MISRSMDSTGTMCTSSDNNAGYTGYVQMLPLQDGACPGCGYCRVCGRYVGPQHEPTITWQHNPNWYPYPTVTCSGNTNQTTDPNWVENLQSAMKAKTNNA